MSITIFTLLATVKIMNNINQDIMKIFFASSIFICFEHLCEHNLIISKGKINNVIMIIWSKPDVNLPNVTKDNDKKT